VTPYERNMAEARAVHNLEGQRDHLTELLDEARTEIDYLRHRVSELEAAELPAPVAQPYDRRLFGWRDHVEWEDALGGEVPFR
jgi:hypothetical protein